MRGDGGALRRGTALCCRSALRAGSEVRAIGRSAEG